LRNFKTLSVFIILMLLVAPAATQAQSKQPEISVEQRQVIEKVIQDYLLRNPIIIRQAINALRVKEENTKKARVSETLKTYKQQIFRDETSPVGGNPKGDITVVEFFDYNCGYCKRAATTLKAVVKRNPNIRVVYKEFAILGPESTTAARAALAAHRQGKYIEFHEGLMAGEANESNIVALVKSLGMDYSRFRKDMGGPDIEAILQKNYQLANILGITGTPVFVIGARIIPGAVSEEVLQRAVKEERARLKN